MLPLKDVLDIESFTIDEQEYENTLAEDLEVDPSSPLTLQDSFARQAKLVAVYGFAENRAASCELQRKAEMERIYALVDSRTRNNFAVEGTKFTEKVVHNVVITSPEYQLAQQKHLEAKKTATMLKSAREAIQHRKDMLVTLGANYRAEINNDPLINR